MMNKERAELQDKILRGLELTYQHLLEEKKPQNAELVIMKDGKMIRIKP